MPNFYCLSPECRENNEPEFSCAKRPEKCPKCGFAGTLGEVSLIHLLKRDRSGTIQGINGSYVIACGANIPTVKHFTGSVSAVNCKKCLETVPPEVLNSQETPTLVAPPTT